MYVSKVLYERLEESHTTKIEYILFIKVVLFLLFEEVYCRCKISCSGLKDLQTYSA